jgi:hypothetical protein
LIPSKSSLTAGFFFEQIELEDDAKNDFKLNIMNTDGLERLSQSFSVLCNPDISPLPDIYNVLPKQILVQTAQGLIPLAEEGVTLPAKIEEEFTLLHDEPTLTIKLFQEQDEDPVGTIVISDIPLDKAGRGAKLNLSVEITPKNEMKGIAKIYNRRGTEVSRSAVKVIFPPFPLPELPTLFADYEDLENERQDKAMMSQDPKERTMLMGLAVKISKKIKKLFKELEPDRQEIQQALRELKKNCPSSQ